LLLIIPFVSFNLEGKRMFIVKLYNQSAEVLHIGRFGTLQEAEAGAARGGSSQRVKIQQYSHHL
jgi:hypothetical protein